MRAIDGALDVPAPWKAVKTRTPLTDPEIVHEVLAQGWNRTDTTNEPIPTLGLRLSATAGSVDDHWSLDAQVGVSSRTSSGLFLLDVQPAASPSWTPHEASLPTW
ncbi:hypothetical protein [Ornithinimicrobium panacihumi]|uniref:hypothetical protein n=1 Tax=Ornithinimicrobium panacihumi TaxID=2008449 RepID=UPI003F8CBC72